MFIYNLWSNMYPKTLTFRVVNIEREAKMANLTNFALFGANCL